MMELPEAVCTAMQANDLFAGRRIVDVEAGMHPHKFAWFFGDPASYAQLLTGRTVQRARPVGGQVEIQLDGASLLFNDGVSLRYCMPGDRQPAKHQLRLVFEDGAMLFGSVRMYGGLSAYENGKNDSMYYRVALERPSPLSEAFDAEWFHGLMGKDTTKLTLKGFLATEQRVPGLGNGVLQDILFHAGMHPKRKLVTLDEQEKETLRLGIRDTLADMAALGGRDTEEDLLGCQGRYRTRMSRNTVGKPCEVCSDIILKETWMGGTIYWCPTCQPAPAQKQ